MNSDYPRIPVGKTPAYQRLYSAFHDAILKGELKSGERLPSTRSMCAFYGIARNTVMAAYEQLISEGYLEGRTGAGTYVSAELPEKFLRSERTRSDLKKPKSNALVSRDGVHMKSPRLLAFASGCPDLNHFPRERWLKLYSRQIRKSVDSLNWYGQEVGGYMPLRESIAAYLNTHRGLVCGAEQILLLNGSQSGIDLVARALLGKNDSVALENPCYRGMVRAFRLNQADLNAIPIDEEGMRVDCLEKFSNPPKLAVVTASRQFPLGYSLPVSRRAKLLEWASRNRSWILEDDYDSEFRFKGNPLPAMQGMDGEERTLYLGTFSRSMFPDLRIGYLVVPRRLLKDLQEVWKASGLNPPVLTQATLADFIREGDYLRHVRRMRLLYAKRCAFLKGLIEDSLGDWLEVGPADGGLHLVAFAKGNWSTSSIAKLAMEKSVSVLPISACSFAPIDRDGLVFGFSAYEEAEMEKGVRILKRVFEEMSNDP